MFYVNISVAGIFQSLSITDREEYFIAQRYFSVFWPNISIENILYWGIEAIDIFLNW